MHIREEDSAEMPFFRRRPKFKTIDEAEEKTILHLAREHPEYGRKRLHALLIEHGIDVDPHQLKRFLRSHVGTPPPTRQVPLSTGPTGVGSGVKSHPWLRYQRWR